MNKGLVCYFSASGVTKKVASNIANAIKAYTIIATRGSIKLSSKDVAISAAIDPMVIPIM